MTFIAPVEAVNGSSGGLSVEFLIPAAAEPGQVLTFALHKTGGGADPFSVVGENGGTFEPIHPPGGGVGTPGSGSGRYGAWRHTIIAGDAGKRITVSHGASGRWACVGSLNDGVGPVPDIVTFRSPSGSGTDWVSTAALPALGSGGGDVVILALGQVSAPGPTFSSLDATIREQASTTAATGGNAAAAVTSDAFTGDDEIPARTLSTSPTGFGTRTIISVVYSGAAGDPPAVDLGSDLTVPVGSPVAIHAGVVAGTAPLDTTQWSKVTGPAIVLSGAATVDLSFTVPSSPATIRLRFVATDTAGLQTTKEITVTVVATNQIARPSTDVALTGVTLVGAATLSEVLADDDDATHAEFGNGSSAEFDFEPVSPTPVNTGWAGSVRAMVTPDVVAHSVTIELVQGVTVIKTVTITDLTNAFVDRVIALSEAEAQAIPDRGLPVRGRIVDVAV